jgi:hypothetical protein
VYISNQRPIDCFACHVLRTTCFVRRSSMSSTGETQNSNRTKPKTNRLRWSAIQTQATFQNAPRCPYLLKGLLQKIVCRHGGFTQIASSTGFLNVGISHALFMQGNHGSCSLVLKRLNCMQPRVRRSSFLLHRRLHNNHDYLGFHCKVIVNSKREDGATRRHRTDRTVSICVGRIKLTFKPTNGRLDQPTMSSCMICRPQKAQRCREAPAALYH